MVVKAPKSARTARPNVHSKSISSKLCKSDTRLSELVQELKSTKHELKSARHELEQVLDESSLAIRIINKDFTVRRINRAFSDMTEVIQKDVVGKKCWEIFPSPLCHTEECRLKRIINGEKTIQVEVGRKKQDGATIPCFITTSPLMDETGELTGIIEQFRDITEHRRMVDQVKESEERYRTLIELGSEVGEAVVMLQDVDRKEGIQTFVSDQWSQITGYLKEDLLGASFFDLVSLEDRQAFIDRYRLKTSGKAVPGLYEMKIIRKDGSVTVIEITGAFTTYQGKPADVVYIRDILERKQLENALEDERNKYRSLFDDAPITLWELDYSNVKKYFDELRKQGITDFQQHFTTHPDEFAKIAHSYKMIRYNRAHVDLFEFNDLAVEVEQHWPKESEILFKYFENRVALQDDFIRLANGALFFTKEETVRTIKGNIRYILTKFVIAPGHEDKWDRVFASLTDITQRKNAENELKQYKDKLEELVNKRTNQLKREIEQRKKAEETLVTLYASEKETREKLEVTTQRRVSFSRMLLHELKTPFVSILGSSEMLSHNIKEEPWHNIAENIHRGALLLNRRLNELFDVERAEMGILSLNKENMDPKKLINNTYEYVKQEAAIKGLNVILDLPEYLPRIWGDDDRLGQVLLNLINNAMNFTPKGGELILRGRVEGVFVVFDVEDNGVGMTNEKQKLLFVESQNAMDEKDRPSGLGLGLLLCKKIVELHDGHISVISQIGKGSRFSFMIPIRENKTTANVNSGSAR